MTSYEILASIACLNSAQLQPASIKPSKVVSGRIPASRLPTLYSSQPRWPFAAGHSQHCSGLELRQAMGGQNLHDCAREHTFTSQMI